MVEERTGEEGEEVKFSCRAKLYIWKDEQWKERGLGNCKILQNNSSFESRIVMRREQVMKVCLNLPLAAENPDVNVKQDSDGKALTFGGIDFRSVNFRDIWLRVVFF